jgi:hypothetical protein
MTTQTSQGELKEQDVKQSPTHNTNQTYSIEFNKFTFYSYMTTQNKLTGALCFRNQILKIL